VNLEGGGIYLLGRARTTVSDLSILTNVRAASRAVHKPKWSLLGGQSALPWYGTITSDSRIPNQVSAKERPRDNHPPLRDNIMTIEDSKLFSLRNPSSAEEFSRSTPSYVSLFLCAIHDRERFRVIFFRSRTVKTRGAEQRR